MIMRILRLGINNWPSRIYLIMVTLVAILVTLSYATWDGPDANLIGVWLFFVTLPFCLIGIPFLGDGDSTVALVVLIAVSAFVNAMVIGMLVRLITKTWRGTRSDYEVR